MQHDLHFIADEIYLASDYSVELLGGPPRYVSALTLKIRKPHLFHFVWAFSKVIGRRQDRIPLPCKPSA